MFQELKTTFLGTLAPKAEQKKSVQLRLLYESPERSGLVEKYPVSLDKPLVLRQTRATSQRQAVAVTVAAKLGVQPTQSPKAPQAGAQPLPPSVFRVGPWMKNPS